MAEPIKFENDRGKKAWQPQLEDGNRYYQDHWGNESWRNEVRAHNLTPVLVKSYYRARYIAWKEERADKKKESKNSFKEVKD